MALHLVSYAVINVEKRYDSHRSHRFLEGAYQNSLNRSVNTATTSSAHIGMYEKHVSGVSQMAMREAGLNVRFRPIADIPRHVHNAAMKPNRYEWLHAEQQRIATEGSEIRRAGRIHRQMTVSVLIVTAVLSCMFAVVRWFPRDASGGIQYRYLAPASVVIALASGLMLWKWRVRQLSLRSSAWALLLFSFFILFIGALP